jgi:hypothetical protein
MELVFSAYGRPDLLGQAVAKEEAELGRGSAAMRMEPDPDSHGVRGWLATPGRLILGAFQFLSPVSIPKAHQEASLTS